MSTFRVRSWLRRNDLTIGFTVMALALGTILYVQALATSQLQKQVAEQQQIILQIKGIGDQLTLNSQDRTKQIGEINHHLDCIVTFFSQPDRSQKAINNINTCELTNTSTGQASSTNTGWAAPTQPSKNTTPASTSVATTPTKPAAKPLAPLKKPITDQVLLQDIKNLIKGVQ